MEQGLSFCDGEPARQEFLEETNKWGSLFLGIHGNKAVSHTFRIMSPFKSFQDWFWGLKNPSFLVA
jgi:hypothetical protein